MEILNIFNTGSWPTIMKLVVESADSGLESVESTANSAKDCVWVQALMWDGVGWSGPGYIMVTRERIIPLHSST